MDHIKKFFSYISESVDTGDFSEEYINELLIPMSDLGISFMIHKRDGIFKTVTEGEFSGRGMVSVTFELGNLKKEGNYISDDKFWLFLDEFISFKNRIESDHVGVYLGGGDNKFFTINFLVPGDFKSDIFELEKAYNIIQNELNGGTTDFYYSTIVEIDKPNKLILIRCDKNDYSDRKFKNLISGVDVSNFTFNKIETADTRRGMGEIQIEIKIKT